MNSLIRCCNNSDCYFNTPRTSYFPYMTSFNLHNWPIRQVLLSPLCICRTPRKLSKVTKGQTATKQKQQEQNPGSSVTPGPGGFLLSDTTWFYCWVFWHSIQSFISPWIYRPLIKSYLPKFSDSLPDTAELNRGNSSPNIVRNLRLLFSFCPCSICLQLGYKKERQDIGTG